MRRKSVDGLLKGLHNRRLSLNTAPVSQGKRNTIQRIVPILRPVDTVTTKEFVDKEWNRAPVILKGNALGSKAAPIVSKWFDFTQEDGQQHPTASTYLRGLGKTHVLYEWSPALNARRVLSSLEDSELRTAFEELTSSSTASETPQSFIRFRAPLDLFLAALDHNKSHAHEDKITRLYIAQSAISSLPPGLQEDLAPPRLLNSSSIHTSSIWLGLTPTYTPLHSDPNPNIFRQLYGSKLVRILPPRAGEAVFRKVQSLIGGSADPRLRGEEMMHGPEKDILHDVIWTDRGDSRVDGRTIYEARLDAGDALYMPKGWWHSIKSDGDAASGLGNEGGLNCSINWWFHSLEGHQAPS